MTYVFFNPFFFYEPRMEILELNTRVAGDWSGASMHGSSNSPGGNLCLWSFSRFFAAFVRLDFKIMRVDGIMHVMTRFDVPAAPATWPNSNHILIMSKF
jgi:hypothetical protein